MTDTLYDREIEQLREALCLAVPPAPFRDLPATTASVVSAWVERASLLLPADHPMRFRRPAPVKIRVPNAYELRAEAGRLRAAGKHEEADAVEGIARRREVTDCGCRGRRCPYHPR